jgi:Zn-dependent protease
MLVLSPISGLLAYLALLSAAFNAWIALFNLIPFAIMDGLKVFRWNKLVWAVTFTASLALTVYTLIMTGVL